MANLAARDSTDHQVSTRSDSALRAASGQERNHTLSLALVSASAQVAADLGGLWVLATRQQDRAGLGVLCAGERIPVLGQCELGYG